MADDDLFWTAWKDICARKNAGGFSSLGETEGTFYAINFLVGSVLRGGFHPYFNMASKEEIESAKRAFRELGTPRISEIIESAESVLFPKGVPGDFTVQQEELPSWTEEDIENGIEPEWAIGLADVNEAFYKISNEADMARKRFFEERLRPERKAAPNTSVAADRDPRERGSRPLNTDR